MDYGIVLGGCGWTGGALANVVACINTPPTPRSQPATPSLSSCLVSKDCINLMHVKQTGWRK
jgi:hypothetical protein